MSRTWGGFPISLCLGSRRAPFGRHLSSGNIEAEAAARHATRGKQPSGTSRWCISHRSLLPRDNKQGTTWGWEGKQQPGHKESRKEMQRDCHKRQMTFPTFEDEKCWTLGRMIWVNRLRPYFRQGFIKAGFTQSFHSEWNLLLSVPKLRQVYRRDPSPLDNPCGILANVIDLRTERAATVPLTPGFHSIHRACFQQMLILDSKGSCTDF